METLNSLLAFATVYAVSSIFFELSSAYEFYKEHKVFRITKKIYLYLLIIVASAGVDCYVTKSLGYFSKGALGGLALFVFLKVIIYVVLLISKIFSELGIGGEKFIISNERGFNIHRGDRTKEYYWNSFDDAVFNEKKDAVTFTGREKFVVKKADVSWERFLSNIPKNYRSLDYKFIDNLFADLQTCRACGMLAFNGEQCYYCGAEKWSKELENDYGTDENYLREIQLDVFAVVEPSDKFENFILKDNLFKQDPKWKPLVTKSEVMEYSKKEYWEE